MGGLGPQVLFAAMTEVWVRNPQFCIKECIEVGIFNFAWDRGLLVKNSIDPSRFGDVWLPGRDYRMLMIGDQGTAEVRPGFPMAKPFAVYPTWEYNEDSADDLEELCAHNVGDDPQMCDPTARPPDTVPVAGQEHRVVVIRPPSAGTGVGRQFIRTVAAIQSEYPGVIIHMHGFYGFRAMFAHGFGSVDVEPRSTAQKGKVLLPSGKEVTYEQAAKLPQWVELIGFHVKDLDVPRNRCMFNIKSAQWAGEHFNENIAFKSRGQVEVDTNSPTTPPPFTTVSTKSTNLPATVGDKVVCDQCSLSNTCKYFRVGAVCSLPRADTAELTRLFKSRDSEDIIEGLGHLMETQSERLSMGVADEKLEGEINPEVTKIWNSLFDKGVKLAKLINPGLAPGLKVGVFVGGGQGAAGLVQQANSAPELMSMAVAELKRRGAKLEDITQDMVEALLQESIPAEAKALPSGS